MDCESCHNGFFLKNGRCVKSTHISNCQIYSQQSDKTCLECGANSRQVTIKTCKAVENKIPNCKLYSDSETCSECRDGFVLPDCAPILFSENCLAKQSDANLCLRCNSRSFMYHDNCYYKQDLGLEACTDSGFDLTMQPFACSHCENTSELLQVRAFNATCAIEKFQDFFAGKCISAKLSPDGMSLHNSRQAPLHSLPFGVLFVRRCRPIQLRSHRLCHAMRAEFEQQCFGPTGDRCGHLAGRQVQR